MAKTKIKNGGPLRGKSRVRKLGMGSGKYWIGLKKNGKRR